MNNNRSKQEKYNSEKNELDRKKKDFFGQLQSKENEQGVKSRGGGHNWTTFIEVLLGDW